MTAQSDTTQCDEGESTPKAPYFLYRDLSTLPRPNQDSKPRIPNFPTKMMHMLSRPDLAHIVSWMPHGRSWKVHKPREFEIKVIPTYFEHNKYSSFIRQANGWGFRRMVCKGPDQNSYYHEMFLRGQDHLVRLMKRPIVTTRPPSDARTEPNFYKIAEERPLPQAKATNCHFVDTTTGAKNFQEWCHPISGSLFANTPTTSTSSSSSSSSSRPLPPQPKSPAKLSRAIEERRGPIAPPRSYTEERFPLDLDAPRRHSQQMSGGAFMRVDSRHQRRAVEHPVPTRPVSPQYETPFTEYRTCPKQEMRVWERNDQFQPLPLEDPYDESLKLIEPIPVSIVQSRMVHPVSPSSRGSNSEIMSFDAIDPLFPMEAYLDFW